MARISMSHVRLSTACVWRPASYPVPVRWLIIGAVALGSGCPGADRPPPVESPTRAAPTAVKPQKPRFDFPTGRFAIEHTRKVADHCGTMQWESTRIDIDGDKLTLYSSPDDRLYTVSLDGPALIARGLFNDQSGPRPDCGNDTYTEIWRLERDSADELSGFVTTYSHFNSSDCLHACKAVFSVKVARVKKEE
jgi:hypothetical protein